MEQVKPENPPILIGSKAIKHYFPEFSREPKDTDYIIYEYQKFDEFPEVNQPSDGTRIEYLKNKVITDKYNGTGKEIIDLNDLCTLKASHLMWNINWEKHMFDLQFLLKQGCKIDFKLFYELYDYWNEYHSKNKRSDLKMTKEEFFTNAVNYDEAEHDYLHTLINPVPTYTKVLKDGCEVELDETKFHNLPYEDKLDFVREEVMIMAAERYKGLDYRTRYGHMLKKFIISHAPIWSLIFILENYITLLKAPFNFMSKINLKLKEENKTILT